MSSLDVALAELDTSHLKTEEDLFVTAEQYVPTVLVQVGGDIAAAVWDRCSVGISDAPFTRPEKRAEYVSKAGSAYKDRASARLKEICRDRIIQELRKRRFADSAGEAAATPV